MEEEAQKPDEPVQTPPASGPQPSPNLSPQSSRKKLWLVLVGCIVTLLIITGLMYWLFHKGKPAAPQNMPFASSQSSANSQTSQAQGLQLDPNKNYGNKYADGILPVGDGKYQTTGAKQGYAYVCAGYAQILQASQGGAGRRGPWFIGTTQYDINKKLHVEGSVMWQASFSNKVSGNTRTIISNDLPDHKTGVFPVSPTDPSYAYDRNPNLITEQSFTYNLSANPTYGSPQCIGGQVGVMLTGVAMFSGFDAEGRDAGAWEIQDSCDGHPQKDGIYHYHTLSSCISNISAKTVIGFALDGFPITGPQVGTNNILTTSDLDECHGITSPIVLDGKNVTMYHYVMTQDFPYSVSCFRSKAIQPPGQQSR